MVTLGFWVIKLWLLAVTLAVLWAVSPYLWKLFTLFV